VVSCYEVHMGTYTPPLHVHVVYHPRHEDAKRWAEALVKWLNGNPEDFAAPQADIPVFVWTSVEGEKPPKIPWGRAKQEVLVVLAGTAMVAHWREWAEEQAKPGGPRIITCTDTPHSGNLGATYAAEQAVRLDKLDATEREGELLLRVTHALARKLLGQGESTSLFISHTKRYSDQKTHEDDGRAFALSLKQFLDERPSGTVFFDEVQISATDEAQDVIHAGVASSVMVALHTDRFSSRYWCGWEILQAKLQRRPILVVDALHDGEPQSLSYLGNAHTLRWDPKDRDSVPRRRRLVSAALLELLRLRHDESRLRESQAAFGLQAAHLHPFRPELATLPREGGKLIHPDPPLPVSERKLIAGHRPDIEIVSLTQALAHHAQKLGGRQIAVSISEAPDLGAFGMSKLHLERIWTRVATHLLQTQARLAYGGDLRQGGYTEQLFELVRGAIDAGAQLPKGQVHLYLGWPVHLTLTDEIKASLPSVFALNPVGIPAVDGVDPQSFIKPQTMVPRERLAWTLGMTAMRRHMAHDCDARVMVGGQFRAVSPIPGLVEELLTFIDLGKPVYLIGGFGGMARVIARALLGERPQELTTAFQDEDGKRTEIRQFIDAAARAGTYGKVQSGGREWPALEPIDFEAIVDRLGKLGLAGLKNGLDVQENLRLIESQDPVEQVGLVLLGLGRQWGNTSG